MLELQAPDCRAPQDAGDAGLRDLAVSQGPGCPACCAQQARHARATEIGSVRCCGQGSAADLVKWAMVDLHTRLRAAFTSPRACRLLLQVRMTWQPDERVIAEISW